MILSPDELVTLTARQRKSAQARVLAAIGVPYRRRPDGSLVVHSEDVLGEPRVPSIPELWERFHSETRAAGSLAVMTAQEYSAAQSNLQEGVIYFHALGGTVEYVGQSVDVDRRRIAHQQEGRQWDQEWILRMPAYWPFEHRAYWLDAVEDACITYFDPPHNVRRVGHDRRGKVRALLTYIKFSLPLNAEPAA